VYPGVVGALLPPHFCWKCQGV